MFGKEKILVEIITEKGVKKKKCEVEGNSVIITKGSRGRGKATHKADFDKSCILTYKTFFQTIKQKLMLMQDADKCISFKNGEVDLPIFDRETSNRHIRANVVKNAGATTQKVTIPMTAYLILGAILVLAVFDLLISTGRVRLL